VGLPAFLCNIAENPGHALLPLYAAEGMGCHPRREIALLRALTEAVQSRLTLISGARDDMFPSEYQRLRDGAALRLMWEQVRASPGARPFSAVPSWSHDSFDEDVALEITRLAAAGMDQVIIVDLTRAEFGIPVVRALVPGLECFVSAARYQPGARALAARQQAGEAVR
jgi:ribosomal protein S12 methylthiotransferase accessory factor